MKRFQSIQTQLLLLLGTVLLTILLIIAVTIFTFVLNTERELWLGRQVEAGRNATAQVNNYIAQAKAVIQFGLRFVVQSDNQTEQINRLLANAIERNRGFLEILVVNADGNPLYTAAADEAVLSNLFTIQQSRWFQNIRNASSDAAYLSDVQISPNNTPYVIISARTDSGNVIAIRLSLSVLEEIISQLRFGTTGKTYVVQSTGIVAAHPDRETIPRVVSLAGRPELESVFATGGTTWTGEYVNFQGEAIIGTTTLVTGTNLAVITEITQAEATTNTRRIFTILSVGVIGIWLGAVLLIAYFQRRLVFAPLKRLQEGAAEIEAGNLQYQVVFSQRNEIGQLADSFNAMARSLDARAAERERLIKDLQAAKRLAEENSRLKSEFLSTMSHELRTPMNAIEGFTSIMLSRMGGVEFNEKTERYITRVNVNSKRLLQLINDFLDLSRVESGRLELAYQPFSPAELAKRWQTEIGVLAERKNIGFELTLDPHLPETVYGDEEAISKVALNLLSNAIKFTEQGKVSLSLSNGGDNWRIIVADTGIGIPPHAREYVFEEFRQVDQTSKRKYGGTGLGLAIVQKYTRTMGGTVTLQSEVGEGSTFTISLPLQTQLEPRESQA
jgi:signal transduction histidine kinase